MLCVGLLSYIGVLVFVKIPAGSLAAHLIVTHITLSREYVALDAKYAAEQLDPLTEKYGRLVGYR